MYFVGKEDMIYDSNANGETGTIVYIPVIEEKSLRSSTGIFPTRNKKLREQFDAIKSEV
jgi:hypothetical protein